MIAPALLASLLAGVAEHDGDGFSVVEIPGADGYLVGRGSGTVVLLTPPDPQPGPARSLRNLLLAPRLSCTMTRPGHQPEVTEAGLVQLADDELLDHFLAVSAAFVELLGPDPLPGVVTEGMLRLARLFDPTRPRRESEIGVWGELAAILLSTDPVAMVDAWHEDNAGLHDFAGEALRAEVKTTTATERIHRFDLAQLVPPQGVPVVVVSIMTTSTDLGASVKQLVAEVCDRLGASPDRQLKVQQVVASALGPDWRSTARKRYDLEAARSTVRLFDATQVPQVRDVPDAVLRVEIDVDLGGADVLPPGAGALVGALGAALPHPG